MCLTELKLHLDLPEMPIPGLILFYDGLGIYSASKFDRFPAIVNKTADVVAREFGTCLKLLSIFTPTEDESMWACFEVNQGRVIRKYCVSCSIRRV